MHFEERPYLICSKCDNEAEEECANDADHLCKHCEGLPHGKPFRMTPELMEAARKAAETFKEERGASEIIKKKLLAKTSSFNRHHDESDLELLVESVVDYLDELHREIEDLKRQARNC